MYVGVYFEKNYLRSLSLASSYALYKKHLCKNQLF